MKDGERERDRPVHGGFDVYIYIMKIIKSMKRKKKERKKKKKREKKYVDIRIANSHRDFFLSPRLEI